MPDLQSDKSSQKLCVQDPLITPNPDVTHDVATPLPKSELQPSTGPRIRIRDPEYLFDDMNRAQIERCVRMCKEKVDSQTITINPLITRNPDITHDVATHSPKLELQPSTGPRIRIRYPGDLVDLEDMDRIQLKRCVRMCKDKVASQTVTIRALRRQVSAKDKQITKLRALVRDLKKREDISMLQGEGTKHQTGVFV